MQNYATGTSSGKSVSYTDAGQTIDQDETITLGWRPKLVILYGQTHAQAWSKDVYKKGRIEYVGSASTGTGMTFVDAVGGGVYVSIIDLGATSISASYIDSGIGITVTLSVFEFTDTGFVIRTRFSTAHNGGGKGDSSQISWVALN
ncbi:MAG: hypothetical protein QME81_17160 [bacterium]|nr:hypothetical protein [bacterium]